MSMHREPVDLIPGRGGVKVRLAIPPTAFLHVGAARTALVNWLFARRHAGTVVLRIEDAQKRRASEASVRPILEDLRWLGVDWDEGPRFQSEGVDAHRVLARRLVDGGMAYPCFCDPAEIARRRAEADRAGVPWRYEGICSDLSAAKARARGGVPAAVRLRVPHGEVTWNDLAHGTRTAPAAVAGDFVILRADGSPGHDLSCVADDRAAGITHVIRGDDHLGSTPRQLLLWRALGIPPPVFAHLPALAGPDGRRLRARHGDVSVAGYRERGFLPEAMIRFLADPDSLQEGEAGMGDEESPLESFRLGDLSRTGSILDPNRLQDLNARLMGRARAERLADLIRPSLARSALWHADLDPNGARRGWFLRVVEALKPRAALLPDLARAVMPFLTEKFDYEAGAIGKYLDRPARPDTRTRVAARMRSLRDRLAGVEPFTERATEEAIRGLAVSRGEAAALYIHPLRVALVGRAESAGVFTILELLGRARVLARIDRLERRLEGAEAADRAGTADVPSRRAVDSPKSVR